MLSGQFSREGVDSPAPEGYEKVTEGFAAVLFPPAMQQKQQQQKKPKIEEEGGGEDDDDGQSVFYNPAQVVNRDLSVCAIETFSQLRRGETRREGGTGENGITILEALSASGLRAIRYFKEITGVRYVIANDLDADAVECIARNCEYNGVPTLKLNLDGSFSVGGKQQPNREEEAQAQREAPLKEESVAETIVRGVIPNHDDAIDIMHRLGVNPNVHNGGADNVSQSRVCRVALPAKNASRAASVGECPTLEFTPLLQQELMDCVDLDPYGTASPFLEGAMRCIKEGGLMLVTSTDSPILCGNYPDTGFTKYHSIPHKGAACHEMAVRMLLAFIERTANRHQKTIVPLLSMHIDFYVRCFFRVYSQQAAAKLSVLKLAHQLQCTTCPAHWVRPLAVVREPRKRHRNADEVAAHTTATAGGGADNETSDGVRLSAEQLAAEDYPEIPSYKSNCKVHAISLNRFPDLTYEAPQQFVNSTMDGGDAPEGSAEQKRNKKKARRQLASMGAAAQATAVANGSQHAARCPVCGSSVILSGPIYAAPTQNREFLAKLLKTIEERHEAKQVTAYARIKGLVTVAMEELPRSPLHYSLPDIASYVRARCPPTPLFIASLARLGYEFSQVHCNATGIKTNCPPQVLIAAMRAWKAHLEVLDAQKEKESSAAEAPASDTKKNESRVEEQTLATAAQESAGGKQELSWWQNQTMFQFDYDRQYDWRGSTTGQTKFVPNAPGWGPKRRHQGIKRGDSAANEEEKEEQE